MTHAQNTDMTPPDCFYLLHEGEECNFTIESLPNLLPHDGVFAVIVADESGKNDLFKNLMDRTYDFDPIDALCKGTLLEGYCIYNIGFSEAFDLAELVSAETILYRSLDKMGIYSTASREPLQEIIFED